MLTGFWQVRLYFLTIYTGKPSKTFEDLFSNLPCFCGAAVRGQVNTQPNLERNC